MVAVVGFAWLGLGMTPVGKQVFLPAVATIPNAMLCMTTTAATVQKEAAVTEIGDDGNCCLVLCQSNRRDWLAVA